MARANEFSTLQKTDIFNYLSKFRIYNSITVNKENDLIKTESSKPVNINDVDLDMKLGVYTWFPYQSSNRCTEVNDITLLDSWVISAQGHFTKNTDFFPRNIKRVSRMSHESSCKRQWVEIYYELLQTQGFKWKCFHRSIWYGDGFTDNGFKTDERDICSCPYAKTFSNCERFDK